MTFKLDAHPSREVLASFDSGLLRREDHEAVEQHLIGCEICCRAIENLPEDSLTVRIRNYAQAATPLPAETNLDEVGRPNTPQQVPSELIGHPRYEVLGYIGCGGMGVVCKALQRRMDRVVAIKVLHQRLTNRPGFAAQFQQEVKALARLNHPNVVSAYDADQAGDSHFLVMEFVAGEGLDEMVRRRGPLPVAEACDIIRQAAQGLQHAHERGMVHRDVKPQNLMLTESGNVKVVDFGLARLVQDQDSAALNSGRSAPDIIGTPDFMAPEQARDSRNSNVRSDLYSLGCTFWYLLTGASPLPRPTPLQVLMAHQHESPRPIRELRPDVTEEVARLVERMMAKDPAHRFATAGEIVDALPQMIDSTPSARAAPKRKRLVWLVAAAVLVIAGCLTIFCFSRPRNDSQGQAAANLDDAAVELLPMPREHVPPIDPIAAHKREMTNRMLSWLDENNKWGPGAMPVSQLAGEIDSGIAKWDGYQVLFSGELMKSGKPAIAVARLGGFQVFDQLNNQQLSAFTVAKGHSRLRRLRHINEIRPIPPKFELSDLRIDSADQVDLSAPITGVVRCHFTQAPGPKSGLRLSVYFKGGASWIGVIDYSKKAYAAENYALPFSMPPLDSPALLNERLHVVYLEWVDKSGPLTVVQSNTVMALIRFAQ